MNELIYERVLAATPEAIFEAFADPFKLRRWYGAPPGSHRVGADGEVAPGEPFRVALVDGDGAHFAQIGRVVEVEPGERLVLEMAWEDWPLGPSATTVAIAFEAVPGGTRVEVRQGPFAHRRELEAHQAYWETGLARLARVVSGEAVPCFEEFWEESRGYTDPIGVAAYTVLAGLREAGAPPAVVAEVEDALYAHLTQLPEETAAVLGAVLRGRLNAP